MNRETRPEPDFIYNTGRSGTNRDSSQDPAFGHTNIQTLPKVPSVRGRQILHRFRVSDQNRAASRNIQLQSLAGNMGERAQLGIRNPNFGQKRLRGLAMAQVLELTLL